MSDNNILIIQIFAFVVLLIVQIVSQFWNPLLDKEAQKQTNSFLQIMRKGLNINEATELNIIDYWNTTFISHFPDEYKVYYTFNSDNSEIEKKENEKTTIWVVVFGTLILLTGIIVINLLFLVKYLSFFAFIFTCLIPISVFQVQKEKLKGKTSWYLLIHPNDRTNGLIIQIAFVFIFLSCFISLILYKIPEDMSIVILLIILSVYPLIIFTVMLFYKIYYQNKWKKKWKEIFSLISEKSIENNDLLNFSIASEFYNKVDRYSVFPLNDNSKIYFLVFTIIQVGILLLSKLWNLVEKYL